MSEHGTFFWDNHSALLLYTVEGNIHNIISIDDDGREFLEMLNLGYEIVLKKQNGDTFRLVIESLTDSGSHIECRATAQNT